MKTYSILVVTLLLLKTCSAGIWSSDTNQVDPVEAEKDLPESPTSKYDYKLSFKKPYYYNDSVPFWSTGGGNFWENKAAAHINVYDKDVLKGEEFIRLSPSIPNTSGWIWSEIKNPYEEWETEVSFRVTGTHLHGGRGLAFWYTKDREQPGPIFGSTDKWDGLSIWLDSANPVVKKKKKAYKWKNDPYI